MSRENVEIVRRAFTASTSRPPDLATVAELYARDHVLTSDWGVEGRTYLGAAGFAEAIADLDAAWQDWHQEVDELLDAGEDDVVVLVRLVARGRGSGAPVEQEWAMIVTLCEGKIEASRTFLERTRALREAGLSEGPPAGS